MIGYNIAVFMRLLPGGSSFLTSNMYRGIGYLWIMHHIRWHNQLVTLVNNGQPNV